MAGNYTNLLATIAANIYTNNNNEVTAAMVKTVMDQMVASLGDGYQYMGIARPSDTPSAYSDLRCFWIASEAGTYTDFGGMIVNEGEVAVLKWDSAWSIEIANNYPKMIMDSLGLSIVRGDELAGSVLGSSYMGANGQIGSTGSGMYCYVYPVTRGQRVAIYGRSGTPFTPAYVVAGFFVNTPVVGEIADETIAVQQSGRISLFYTAPSDGCVVTWHRDNTYEVKAYACVLSPFTQMRGKVVAVLGDSIMEYMGGSVLPANSITLKNITDPGDTNVYTEADATIVGGYIYLTSTLVDGEVVPSSERLEIVNSKQTEIDAWGWESLKDRIGAKDVINCAMGGGRVTEMGVVTEYPSVTSGSGFRGKVESLPNQVRMLQRLTASGIRPRPNCIIIWMGVNGTTEYATDSLETAMAIPWTTLSDELAGYSSRRRFFGALRYAIEALYRQYPQTTIFIVSPIQTNRGDEKINSSDPAYRGFTDLKQTAENMKSVAERYACYFVDALTESGIANFSYKADSMDGDNEISTGTPLGNLIPAFLSDGIHPNDLGKSTLLNYIVQKLNTMYFLKG